MPLIADGVEHRGQPADCAGRAPRRPASRAPAPPTTAGHHDQQAAEERRAAIVALGQHRARGSPSSCHSRRRRQVRVAAPRPATCRPSRRPARTGRRAAATTSTAMADDAAGAGAERRCGRAHSTSSRLRSRIRMTGKASSATSRNSTRLIVVAWANRPWPKVRKMKMLRISVVRAGPPSVVACDDVEAVHRAEQRGRDVERDRRARAAGTGCARTSATTRRRRCAPPRARPADRLEPGQVDEHRQAHPLPGVDERDDHDRPGGVAQPGDLTVAAERRTPRISLSAPSGLAAAPGRCSRRRAPTSAPGRRTRRGRTG